MSRLQNIPRIVISDELSKFHNSKPTEDFQQSDLLESREKSVSKSLSKCQAALSSCQRTKEQNGSPVLRSRVISKSKSPSRELVQQPLLQNRKKSSSRSRSSSQGCRQSVQQTNCQGRGNIVSRSPSRSRSPSPNYRQSPRLSNYTNERLPSVGTHSSSRSPSPDYRQRSSSISDRWVLPCSRFRKERSKSCSLNESSLNVRETNSLSSNSRFGASLPGNLNVPNSRFRSPSLSKGILGYQTCDLDLQKSMQRSESLPMVKKDSDEGYLSPDSLERSKSQCEFVSVFDVGFSKDFFEAITSIRKS